MDNNIKIAGEYTVQNWLDLRGDVLVDSDENWDKVYEIYELRLKSRFLVPIERIKNGDLNSGEGFSISLIGVVLLEFLAAVHLGKRYIVQKPNQDYNSKYEYASSVGLLKEFFSEVKIFKNCVDGQLFNSKFYEEVRCGLVHEARTKGDTVIKSNKTESESDKFYYKKGDIPVFHRDNFLKALDKYLDWHKDEILKAQNQNLRLHLLLKMDDICEIKHIWYFAYGSNLLKSKFEGRLLELNTKKYDSIPSTLRYYKFVYNKKRKDGSAAANLIGSKEDAVQGVCFLMDREKLDEFGSKYEKGYNQREILVEGDAGTFKARTYISDSFLDAKPSNDYTREVVDGAREWDISEDYIKEFLTP